jgi:predicted DNA-binding protein
MEKIRFTTYIEKDTAEKLKTLSKETRIPQAQYVQEAIEMLLKKYQNEDKK